MVVTSIINQKGGVGKTTTAVNLAAGLVLEGKRTLLVDIDPQANATTGVGVEPDAERNIYHAMVGQASTDEIMRETETSGLWAIPSHIRLAKRITELDARTYREELLRNALSQVRNRFDFVIIDAPPALNILSINAIAASDRLIIPCKMGRFELDGLGDLFDTIQEVSQGRPPLSYKLLMTLYEARNTRTNEAVEQELQSYRQEGHVYDLMIRKNEALNQAHMVGKPIFDHEAKSNGAEDYRALTLEVLKK